MIIKTPWFLTYPLQTQMNDRNTQSFNADDFQCTASLENILLIYAQSSFDGNADQEHAFAQIIDAFILKLHKKCKSEHNAQ